MKADIQASGGQAAGGEAVVSKSPPRFGAGFNKGAFYRTCRMLHAYLSAGAFITLMFFAISGLMLNHPEWPRAVRDSGDVETVTLDPDGVASALTANDPARALAELVGRSAALRGAFQDAEVFDDEAFLRFTGVKGASDVAIDLTTGEAEVEISRANVTSIVHDLHRGKDAGAAWKLFIDVSAIVIFVMSAIGFVLFFSLRLRFATSMKIVGATLALVAGLVLFAAP